ncbi:hypothetical protein N9043_00305 [bacterium]|nr:hypothetical protein [bacterium]
MSLYFLLDDNHAPVDSVEVKTLGKRGVFNLFPKTVKVTKLNHTTIKVEWLKYTFTMDASNILSYKDDYSGIEYVYQEDEVHNVALHHVMQETLGELKSEIEKHKWRL